MPFIAYSEGAYFLDLCSFGIHCSDTGACLVGDISFVIQHIDYVTCDQV